MLCCFFLFSIEKEVSVFLSRNLNALFRNYKNKKKGLKCIKCEKQTHIIFALYMVLEFEGTSVSPKL